VPKQRTGYVYFDKERKTWIARVTFPSEEGKRRNVKRAVISKTEGKLLLKRLINEIDDHGESTVDGDRLTFHRLAEIYAEYKLTPPVYKAETRVSGLRSFRSQRTHLRALVAHFGARRVKTITHSDIDRFRALRLQTMTRRGRDRSVSSVNRELSLLRAMLDFARRSGWLLQNPFGRGPVLISPADEAKRERILTFEEEARLLAACTGPRAHLRPLVIAALDTAMRLGELLKLKWSDLNFQTDLIRVRKTTTKTWEARTIGLTTRLRTELERLQAVAPPDPDGLVFGITNNVKRSFVTACRKAVIDDLRFHDLRHTATTWMIQGGMPSMEVMKITGHKEMATFARYVNTDGQAAKRAASALDTLRAAQVAQDTVGLVN
jgi:integrase